MRGGLLELAGGQLKKIMRTMVYKILRFVFCEREVSYNNKPSYALPVKQQKYLFYTDDLGPKILITPVLWQKLALFIYKTLFSHVGNIAKYKIMI